MGDRPLDVADAHEVVQAQRPRVGERESAHHLVDDAARSERDHETDEDADALERVGAGAGQVRVGEREREQPQQAADQAPGRLGGLRIDPGHGRASLLDRGEDQPGEAHGQPRDQHDQHDGEEVGHRVEHALPERDDAEQQELAQRLAPRPRVGEAAQDEGQPAVGNDQPGGDREGPDQELQPFDQP